MYEYDASTSRSSYSYSHVLLKSTIVFPRVISLITNKLLFLYKTSTSGTGTWNASAVRPLIDLYIELAHHILTFYLTFIITHAHQPLPLQVSPLKTPRPANSCSLEVVRLMTQFVCFIKIGPSTVLWLQSFSSFLLSFCIRPLLFSQLFSRFFLFHLL